MMIEIMHNLTIMKIPTCRDHDLVNIILTSLVYPSQITISFQIHEPWSKFVLSNMVTVSPKWYLSYIILTKLKF